MNFQLYLLIPLDKMREREPNLISTLNILFTIQTIKKKSRIVAESL